MPPRIGDAGLLAEQSVLGGILLDPEALPHVALEASDFSRGDHARIFRAMHELVASGSPLDVVTLANRITGVRPEYLVDLLENTPTAVNLDAWADEVRKASRKRQALSCVNAAGTAILKGDRATADVIVDLAASLEGMTTDSSTAPATMSEVVSHALEAAHAARERAKVGGVVGAPSGLPTLDKRMGGLHGPRLIIPAARPGTGKTALMYQWAQHAAARGFRVGIVSLEMSESESGLRALAVNCGLNSAALARGASDEYDRLQQLVSENRLTPIRALPIIWDFSSFTLNAVIARITSWRRMERIDFAIVDHVGLIEAEGYTSRVEQLGAISRTLKKLAKRLDIPIVAVSQLSRANERDKRPPQLSDLRDSGNLEQDADVVLMLHATGEPDAQGVVEVELGLLKCRDGVRGWLPCSFLFDGRAQRFREVAAEGTRGSAGPSARRRGGQ